VSEHCCLQREVGVLVERVVARAAGARSRGPHGHKADPPPAQSSRRRSRHTARARPRTPDRPVPPLPDPPVFYRSAAPPAGSCSARIFNASACSPTRRCPTSRIRARTCSVGMIRSSPLSSSSTSTEVPGAKPRVSSSRGIETTLLLPTRRTLTTFMPPVYTRISALGTLANQHEASQPHSPKAARGRPRQSVFACPLHMLAFRAEQVT